MKGRPKVDLAFLDQQRSQLQMLHVVARCPRRSVAEGALYCRWRSVATSSSMLSNSFGKSITSYLIENLPALPLDGYGGGRNPREISSNLHTTHLRRPAARFRSYRSRAPSNPER